MKEDDNQPNHIAIYAHNKTLISLNQIYYNCKRAIALAEDINNSIDKTEEKRLSAFMEKHDEEKERHVTKQHEELVVSSSSEHEEQPTHQTSQKNSFRWTQTPSEYFAIACEALGIKTAKPRELLRLMPAEWNLDASMVGSHLEKYRLYVVKDNHLESASELNNTKYLLKYSSNEYIEKIIQNWSNPNFKGYTELEIQRMLSELNVELDRSHQNSLSEKL